MAYSASEEDKHSMSTYESKHSLILHGRHPVSHLIIRTEHLRLLHAGPTLLASSLKGTTLLEVEKLFVQSHVPV